MIPGLGSPPSGAIEQAGRASKPGTPPISLAVPERHRPLLSLALACLLVAVVLAGVVGSVAPAREPASFTAPPAAHARLARRLMLVIVDGLRYDVARDPARMPELSRALEQETSGELWAGRVSMTTSAVLTIGTGQRGGFEQILRNANPRPPPFDSWLGAARAAGLTLMSVGDPAWVEMYGSALRTHRLDPAGVAIDVDFNPITFRDARELRARNPDVLIVHFVTPDHQAHAYTVPSQRYAAHMRGFDRELSQFLSENSPDWTLIVAGDHGAADSGTHGADVPVQRRTVLLAKGPGIQPGQRLGSVDQADLAGTCAALLGLPAPAHSRGHLLVSLLDVSPATRVALACNDAARARAFARASGLVLPAEPDCTESADPLGSARASVASVDRAFEAEGGPAVPWLTLASVLLALAAAFVAAGWQSWREIVAVLAVLGLGVALTWGVERLPGSAPHTTRIALFVLGNLPALGVLLAPGKLSTWFARAPWVGVALLPGILVATYTTNAQPEAYVALVVASLLFLAIGGLDARRPTLRAFTRVLHPAHLVLLLTCLALLSFAGTRTSELYPAWFRRDPGLLLASAILAIGLLALVLGLRSGHRRRFELALSLSLLAIAALVARRFVPALPGRALLVACAIAALFFALRRQRLPALFFGVASYSWVSRDAELVAVVATLLVADGVGAAFARHRVALGGDPERLEPAQLLLVVCFVFGLAFVQRIGIQGALDFGALDWGAAGFGDPHVPAWVVGGALGLKYLLGLWLVLGAFVSELGGALASPVLRAVFLLFLARTVVLSAMFFVAGSSYWTGLRLLGDLPFAMLWLVAAGIAWAALGGAARLRSPNPG